MLAVVTGASSGIGYELAVELARRGYDLVVASAGEHLTTAAQNLRAYGRKVVEASVDLATPAGDYGPENLSLGDKHQRQDHRVG